MSFIDAQQALTIYKYFCEQTERVVEYLAIARKLSNLISVPIPNLKHVSKDTLFLREAHKPVKAPLSLAKALDEYLHDPNFEQNRIEYKTNKALADGKIPNKAKPQSGQLELAFQPAGILTYVESSIKSRTLSVCRSLSSHSIATRQGQRTLD